jgi:predicted metal-dependent HD superfamily phosphohydrolase
MKFERLEKRWVEFFGLVNESAIVKEAFNDLVSRYSERHRHYHRLEHVNACLELLDEISDSIANLFNIEAAIWFHDVIYDPEKKDNEEKSAKYAKAFLESIGLNSLEIEHLILLTKHPSSPVTSDEKYLIDIDLSILGANEELYDSYELWIREEYAPIPNFLYRKGRKEVLNSFVKLDSIYQTEYFYKKYEIQARQNIDHAIQKL